ncbi:hypothetical protein MMC14_005033 [Varicellaria rhodocarpa]|nr:hypothetical protein [Varicellaria rhodocarpa]
MPFPYTASARNRRLKEREPRSVRTSSSSRRPRDVSRVSDNRSPAPNLQAPHSPLYIQENTTLEQLPPLPSSGTASPSSAASPILQSSKLLPNSAGVYHLTTTPHTPACLRKYLESEPELDTSDFPLAVQEHEETSLAIRDQTDWRQSPAPLPTSDSKPRSLSPILRESGEAATNHSASPPPATILTAEAQLLPSSPKFYSPTPVAPRGPYLTSPHSITPAVPWQEHYSNEYLYSSTYPGPQYYGMVQPNGTAAEGQPYPIHPMPYFTDQGSPHPVPVPYDPTRTLQYQDFSTATGQGNLPYALPTTHYAHVETGGQVRPEGSLSGNQPPEDDTVDLLYRVQNAIPDLHLLLNRYKETSGQLGQQEDLIRQSEAQKAKALRQKEAYIERLVKELEMQSQKYSTESSKLHVEIGNLEEMHRELQDSMVAKTRSNDELEAANQTLQRQNAILEQQAQQALDAANKDLKQVVGEFNDKELSIREDLWSKTRAEEALRAKVLEMSRAHIDEREHLKASWTRERQDIEKSHFGVRLELEKALEACHLDLEKSKGKEQEGRDRWEEDRKGLIQTWDAERLKIGTISEQRYKALEAQHAWEKMDIQSKLKSSRKEPLKRVEEENLELKIEIEKLKIGWDADKKKFERASSELTALADKANRENINLQKMVESFGDVTEFRSHGDPF